jgi:hypothetical protein
MSTTAANTVDRRYAVAEVEDDDEDEGRVVADALSRP